MGNYSNRNLASYDKFVWNGQKVTSRMSLESMDGQCPDDQNLACVHAYGEYIHVITQRWEAQQRLKCLLRDNFLRWSMDKLWHLSIAGMADFFRRAYFEIQRIKITSREIPMKRREYETKRAIVEQQELIWMEQER